MIAITAPYRSAAGVQSARAEMNGHRRTNEPPDTPTRSTRTRSSTAAQVAEQLDAAAAAIRDYFSRA
jgi:hypothetical protein